MLRVLTVGAAALLLAGPACAPSEENEAALTETQATVAQLEHDWVKAIVDKDAAALERLLANDFNGTSPSAHTYTKTVAISDVVDAKFAADKMELDEVAVNDYGDMAVAFTSQQETSRYDGSDTSGHYHYTNVWQRRDGRWQVVASHGTRYDAVDFHEAE